MAAGTFLVGAFAGHAQILDREDVTVQVATQNEDDFIKNMLTILVEERLALAVYVAAAFEKGVVPAGSLVAASEQERGSKK
jgi:HK97 family phage major capsid protein